MVKEKKLTFKQLYKNFRKRSPTMKKHLLGFQPYGYMSIVMWVDSGELLVYDGYENKSYFLKERWR